MHTCQTALSMSVSALEGTSFVVLISQCLTTFVPTVVISYAVTVYRDATILMPLGGTRFWSVTLRDLRSISEQKAFIVRPKKIGKD